MVNIQKSSFMDLNFVLKSLAAVWKSLVPVSFTPTHCWLKYFSPEIILKNQSLGPAPSRRRELVAETLYSLSLEPCDARGKNLFSVDNLCRIDLEQLGWLAKALRLGLSRIGGKT